MLGRIALLFALPLAGALVVACGVKGPPLPPATVEEVDRREARSPQAPTAPQPAATPSASPTPKLPNRK